MEYDIVYDTTRLRQQSIGEVIQTLLEAIVLVASWWSSSSSATWRASLIPLLAVPVSVVGTFAVMLGFGFSINTLSLFGHGPGDRYRRRRRHRGRRERRA
jgi:multidrug efflux pump